jgi:phosphatidylserine/phosphatidylglycerophosphate/cardiolipin synthase-like enzyme
VSYAVYKVDEIAHAIQEAVHRSVEVTILLEDSPGAAPTSAMRDGLGNLGSVRFLVWPERMREETPSGQRGAMHVKCAVADRSMLLLSSANLTDHAFNLNMELGLLVKGGQAPATAADHFDRLLKAGVLEAVPS